MNRTHLHCQCEPITTRVATARVEHRDLTAVTVRRTTCVRWRQGRRTITSAGARHRVGGWVTSRTSSDSTGESMAASLRQVLEGRDPVSGDRLSRSRHRRVPGFDLTFCAPKSVSVLWALSDHDVARAVRDAHGIAVEAALRYLEEQACWSRRGTNGVVQVAGTDSSAPRFGIARAEPVTRTCTLTWSSRTRPAATTADGARSTVVTCICTPRPPATSTRPNSGPSSAAASVSSGHRSSTASPTSSASRRRCSIGSRLDGTRSNRRWQNVVSASARAAQYAVLDTRQAKDYDVDPTYLHRRWADQVAEIGWDSRRAPGTGRPDHPRAADPPPDRDHPCTPGRPRRTDRQASTFDRRDGHARLVRRAHRRRRHRAHRTARRRDPRRSGRRAARSRRARPGRHDAPTRERPGDRHPQRPGPATRPTNSSTSKAASCAAPDADATGRRRRRRRLRGARGVGRPPGSQRAGRDGRHAHHLGTCGRCRDRRGRDRQDVQPRRRPRRLATLRTSRHRLPRSARAAAELETTAGIPQPHHRQPARRSRRPPPPWPDRATRCWSSTKPAWSAPAYSPGSSTTRTRLTPRSCSSVIPANSPRSTPADCCAASAVASPRSDSPRIDANTNPGNATALDHLRDGHVDEAIAAYHQHGRIHTHDTAIGARDAMTADWWAATLAGDRALMLAPRWSDVDDLNARARHHYQDAGMLTGPILTDRRPPLPGRRSDHDPAQRPPTRRPQRNLRHHHRRRPHPPVADGPHRHRHRPRLAGRVPRRRSRPSRLRHHDPQSPRPNRRPCLRARLRHALPRSRLRRPLPRPTPRTTSTSSTDTPTRSPRPRSSCHPTRSTHSRESLAVSHAQHLAVDTGVDRDQIGHTLDTLIHERDRLQQLQRACPPSHAYEINTLTTRRDDIAEQLAYSCRNLETIETQRGWRHRKDRNARRIILTNQTGDLGAWLTRLDDTLARARAEHHRHEQFIAEHSDDLHRLPDTERAIHARIHQLVDADTIDPPAYLRHLGTPPDQPVALDRWRRAAHYVERQRAEHHITDPDQPFGPEPVDPTATSWHFHHHNLDQLIAPIHNPAPTVDLGIEFA